MKKVEGYVCLAVPGPNSSFNSKELMFGPNPKQGLGVKHFYPIFPADPIVLFTTRWEAEEAKRSLAEGRAEFESLKLGYLTMEISETLEEVELFEGQTNLVVLIIYGAAAAGSANIYGARVEGCKAAYPLAGAELSENGMVPFNNFHAAMLTLREASRQSQCRCCMATFNLERFKR